MSAHYGPINQLGYVVNNIEKSKQYWIKTMGVGPWWDLGEVPFKQQSFRGKESHQRVKASIAYSGDLQIELIQVVDSSAIFYLEPIAPSDAEGQLHHVCWQLDEDTYEQAVAATIARGENIVFESRIGRSQVVYFESGAESGFYKELSTLGTPFMTACEELKLACQRGTDQHIEFIPESWTSYLAGLKAKSS